MVCETVTSKMFLVTFIGVNVMAEIVRLRLSTEQGSHLQFVVGAFMISFYFVFLASLLSKSIRGLSLVYTGLSCILTLLVATFMYCAVAIASDRFEHNVSIYLDYVYGSVVLGVSVCVQMLVLEGYIRQIVEQEEIDERKGLDV